MQSIKRKQAEQIVKSCRSRNNRGPLIKIQAKSLPYPDNPMVVFKASAQQTKNNVIFPGWGGGGRGQTNNTLLIDDIRFLDQNASSISGPADPLGFEIIFAC
jgi:hypothetical protein